MTKEIYGRFPYTNTYQGGWKQSMREKSIIIYIVLLKPFKCKRSVEHITCIQKYISALINMDCYSKSKNSPSIVQKYHLQTNIDRHILNWREEQQKKNFWEICSFPCFYTGLTRCFDYYDYNYYISFDRLLWNGRLQRASTKKKRIKWKQ